ncbi:MAG: type II secretion system F family protein [Chloroflexi bacterium]|nr:type II secretion system F family protein [Chloroflexota bacterium]
MAIRYVAYNSEGRRVSGVLPVETPAQAEEFLWRSELVVASLKPERSRIKQLRRQLYGQLPTFFRPKAMELVSFARELATLLQAGIPLNSGLQIVEERAGNLLLREAIGKVRLDIQAGNSLSQAMARHPGVFPTLYCRLVTVAEETGRLELVLHEVANYLESQATLTRKITSALRYPAMVGLVGIVAGYVLLTYSLPALGNLFQEFGSEMPLPAKILIGVTNFAQQWAKLGPLILIALAVGLWLYFRTPRGAATKDALVLRAPFIGRAVRLALLYRFTSSLYTMLSAGIPLAEALELSARTSGNLQLRQALVRTREDILGGNSFSQAVSRQMIFPSIFCQMVVVGERAGTLSQNLLSLSKFFDAETDRAITALTAMIEPTLILVIGGAVGFVAMAVMSTLYGVIGQIR